MPAPASKPRAAGCLGPAAALLLLVAVFAGLRIYDESHRPAVQKAARDGDLASLSRLLDSGTDVNERGYPDDGTPLHAAALAGQPAAAELLIRHGADVNVRDRFGCAPLHRAADEIGKHGAPRDTRPGRLAVAELLLRHGARVDTQTNIGYTPLHRAVSSNHVELDVRLQLDVSPLARRAETNRRGAARRAAPAARTIRQVPPGAAAGDAGLLRRPAVTRCRCGENCRDVVERR